MLRRGGGGDTLFFREVKEKQNVQIQIQYTHYDATLNLNLNHPLANPPVRRLTERRQSSRTQRRQHKRFAPLATTMPSSDYNRKKFR